MKIIKILFCSIFCSLIVSGLFSQGTYNGSGSVTKGRGITTNPNIFSGCPGSRVSAIGTITSLDKKNWILPAENNFLGAVKLSDLYNECNNVRPANLNGVNLNNVPITEIDFNGDIITGFIFSDNYFELYINGKIVGVDPVPYTPFNSCIVRFKVKRPYTISVLLIDWEENLGLGTENNNGNLFHAGDGGFIAQFSDGTVTDTSWRAQTYYIAPIENLSTIVELPDSTRSTASASTSPSCKDSCFAIHYNIPKDWNNNFFNDSAWPKAKTYSANQVTNSVSYTNFASTAWKNADFIWTSNLILDNIVLARKTVGNLTGTSNLADVPFIQIENPFFENIILNCNAILNNAEIRLTDLSGREIQNWNTVRKNNNEKIELKINTELLDGIYIFTIKDKNIYKAVKLIHCKK